MLAAALAVASAFAGIATVRAVWRRPLRRKGLFLLAGWALIGLSLFFWTAAYGIEYGTAYAFCSVSLLAWSVVALNLERRARAPEAVGRRPPSWLPLVMLLQHAARLVLTAVAAAVASFCATMGASRLFPIADMERHAFVIVLFPIVWGTLIYAIGRSSDLRWPFALTTLLGGAGAGVMLV